MWRAGRRMKTDIEGRLESSSRQDRDARAFAGRLRFTLLMITREGMETALLMNTLLFRSRAIDIAGGAIAGTIVAAVIAWLWSRYGYRVNLARFFQVTAIFLLVFVVQLLIYGFHELTEANVFPGSERAALGDGALRPRRRVRPLPELYARRASAGVAGALQSLRQALRPSIAGRVDSACRSRHRLSAARARLADREGSAWHAPATMTPMKAPTKVELVWEHDLVFGGRSGAAYLTLDSAGAAGPVAGPGSASLRSPAAWAWTSCTS